ncbi:UNVERIFIED_CONTAM: OVARIAN TUMOR DOMAIN-containing deubiquitinating enzyme 4 [Sesamum angustifolium]|uniref:Ubiquitin thioesterase OTU n=1 Tax=Sesamum angustifolium TaxID=2727405 RepID=A0AAW2M852_9LAMI
MDLGSGIPGDGRCLFRSVVHGACLRAGKPSPTESQEKELADELRATVADEFIKRRADTEWFVEGDFDTYVAQMRQPHVWGEPELLMSSHVCYSRVPITVHMWDKKKNCLKIIAEYGQEYGKENPIRVLYHGYGHYDALQSLSGGLQSKLLEDMRALHVLTETCLKRHERQFPHYLTVFFFYGSESRSNLLNFCLCYFYSGTRDGETIIAEVYDAQMQLIEPLYHLYLL